MPPACWAREACVPGSTRVPFDREKGKLMKSASGAKMTKVSQNEITESMVSFKRQPLPPGLNARRVVSKRYSLKDAKGNSLEEWSDIVARVVAHVSVAETDPAQRDIC